MNYQLFRGQDLSGHSFVTETDWRYCNFRECKLTGANFTGCDLTGCNFRDADLTGAYFSNVTINYANLNDTIQTGTVFSGLGKYSVGIQDTSGLDMTSEPPLYADSMQLMIVEIINQTPNEDLDTITQHDIPILNYYLPGNFDGTNPVTGPYEITPFGRGLYGSMPDWEDGTQKPMEEVLNAAMEREIWFDKAANEFKPKT